MIGISIITYMRVGSNSSDMWGAIMAIVATAGAACYKVSTTSLLNHNKLANPNHKYRIINLLIWDI